MSSFNRVYIVGATGFRSFHTDQEFLKKGWQVAAISLFPTSLSGLFPATVRVIIQDLEQISNTDLLVLLYGRDTLVFAAGLDDRFTFPKPAYPVFYQTIVEIPVRVKRLSKQAMIKRAVVLESSPISTTSGRT